MVSKVSGTDRGAVQHSYTEVAMTLVARSGIEALAEVQGAKLLAQVPCQAVSEMLA